VLDRLNSFPHWIGQVCWPTTAASRRVERAVIARLVPRGVVVAEAYAERWETRLLPEELPIVRGAVEKRRRDFAAGRNCARRALEGLGWPEFPLLSGPNREPLWPPGVLGSITHCHGYCAAVAAREGLDGIRGLGIDAELNEPVPDAVLDFVCTPDERRSLPDRPGLSLPALVFSAKEAVYKAWFPMTGRCLDYRDAEIDLDPSTDRFAVRLLASAPPEGVRGSISFAGRYASTASHLFTLVTACTREGPIAQPR
jgi:4'-phosphopantetheinyl transferase EntD